MTKERFADFRSAVQDAVAFADEWPAEYRLKVFELAVEHLGARGDAGGAVPGAPRGLALIAKEVGVEAQALARVIKIGEGGKIEISGRLDAPAKADRQIMYSTVYCFIRDRVTEQLDTPIEELREVCKAHGCYDSSNFTSYFRESVYLHEGGGTQNRTYRLSARGVAEAKALLKRLVEL
jgi:hypothetical protein